MKPLRDADQNGQLDNILMASSVTDSDRASDRAAMLAQAAGAQLHVVNVIEPGALPKRIVAEAVERMKVQLRDDWRDAPATGGTEVSIEVLVGTPDAAIIEKATDVSADLIIMGLSRNATLSRLFTGTTTEKVVRSSACPVLTIKARPRRPYERILVALDLKSASRRALDFALSAFPTAQFSVVHVLESAKGSPGIAGADAPNLVADMVAARCLAANHAAPGTPGGVEIIVLQGSASTVLGDELFRRAPDLVVLGTHGRTGVANLFLGSVAETLLETAPTDILIARA